MKVTSKKFGEDTKKTSTKAKETNKKLTSEAAKNKKVPIKEVAAGRKTITLSDKAKTSAVASMFGGLAGKAVSALKGRKGQGDE